MGAHGVVEAPAGEDHLRVMAHGLSLVGEVIGTDQSGDSLWIFDAKRSSPQSKRDVPNTR